MKIQQGEKGGEKTGEKGGEKTGEKIGEISPLHLKYIFGSFTMKSQQNIGNEGKRRVKNSVRKKVKLGPSGFYYDT